MATRVFEGYADEHAALCGQAGRLISELREQVGQSRRATQIEAEATLSKAEELVQQMELEVRSAGKGPEVRDMQSRAKAAKAELGAMRTSLRQASAAVPARTELLGGSLLYGLEKPDKSTRPIGVGVALRRSTTRRRGRRARGWASRRSACRAR